MGFAQAISLLGHGLVRPPLLRHRLAWFPLQALIGADHPSQGMYWGRTISLQGKTTSFWDGLISTWMCSPWTPDISLCALTMQAGSRSLHVTRIIFPPYIACIELVRCHINMQIGNIDVTC